MATLDIGAVGRRVAANLKALRAERGVSLRDLSAALREHGRPIIPSGIIRAENGTRRIDVDDLVALAIVLDVTPNRLLLSPDAGSESVTLTGKVSPTAAQAWIWAAGERYLEPGESGRMNLAREGRFLQENRPQDSGLTVSEQIGLEEEHRQALRRITDAIEAAEAEGVPRAVVLNWVRGRLEAARWRAATRAHLGTDGS